MEEATLNQQQMITDFQFKIGAIEEELKLCRTEVESKELIAQDLTSQLLSLQSENEEFAQRVLEYERCQAELCSTNQSVLKDFENRQQELRKENARLQSQIDELQALSSIQDERDELQKDKVELQSTIAQLEEKTHMQSSKIEVMQKSVTSLENNIQQLESQLDAMKLMNSELTEKVFFITFSSLFFSPCFHFTYSFICIYFQLNALHESSLHLHTQHQQELSEAREKHNVLEINHNQLTCQLQESQKQIETYKVRICPSP